MLETFSSSLISLLQQPIICLAVKTLARQVNYLSFGFHIRKMEVIDNNFY